MNIIIAENNSRSPGVLDTLLQNFSPEIVVVKKFDSIEGTVRFLKSNNSVDLMVLDTELSDGNCFEIFDRVQVQTPVIFTSDCTDHALRAFKYLSIDYLIKPIQREDLKTAFQKFERISFPKNSSQQARWPLNYPLLETRKTFRERFMIKIGNKLLFKQVADVAWFFAEGKTVYLVTRTEGRKYIISHTMEDLEHSLNHVHFFRISRKHIIHVDCIAEVKGLISGKLEIKLTQSCDHNLIVSRERVKEFKDWLNQ